MIAIVDSGALVAAANSRDPDHRACADLLRKGREVLVLPALCIAEVCFLIGRRAGPRAEAAFLRSLEKDDVRAPLPEDWARMAELVERYEDLPLGGVDASVIALAERLGATRLITLDRRHFSVVRPRHCERFELLP